MPHKSISLESEAGFRVLFEYATIGILVVGQRGSIELANPSAEALFGYSSAELIGQPLEILIPDALRHKHENHRKHYFEKPKARPMGLGMALYARKKNGDVFPVEISLGHYQLQGEKLAVAFITDISLRVEAEQRMKKVNEELENRVRDRTIELTEALQREKEMNELKSRFVSMASHEFRTPLSAILSSVALMDRYAELGQPEKRKKHSERIRASVKNLTYILNDFLSLEKLEQGKVETENEPIDLIDFGEDIIEEVQAILKPGQTINFSYPGNRKIMLDKKILRNIILNLLSNAIKYSAEGTEIIFSIKPELYAIKFTIADQGIGIPEDEQKHLFDKFFRARNALNYQGTGLGLNIVKRYVELMNGSIEFYSAVNEGTTITITFPVIESRRTVLIIDDNKEINENTKELLELAGYDVFVAFDGQEGIAIAEQVIPDIILCDILMPGISGFEVLSRLKTGSLTRRIPVIFLSANTERKDVDSGLDMGASYYLRKPFEAGEMLDAIERCLENR